MLPVLVEGDSLAVGMRPYLQARYYDAQVGRSAVEGVPRLLARNISGRIVFVSLGTNDFWRPTGWFRRQVRRVHRAVGSGCVVWGTTPNSRRLNGVLWDARGIHFKVVRHVQPGPDGIHPTFQGYKLLAARYKRAAGGC